MAQSTPWPDISVGGQPGDADLARLSTDGFVAVVNLRRPGEPEQPLPPDQEGDKVRAAGLEYLHLPVGGAPISRGDVETFGRFLRDQTGGKVLVHCKTGGRAAAMLLLDRAETEGWASSEVIDRGRELGLVLPPPVLALVVPYLESRP